MISIEVMNKKSIEQRFANVFRMDTTDTYIGNADQVMLVWNEFQVLPAEQYRKAHFANKTTDIIICKDPNVQKKQIGEKALIYHYSG